MRVVSVEYRVRPVVRYAVTRYESGSDAEVSWGGCETVGEFQNEESAERVKAAMEAGDPDVQRTNAYMIVKSGFDVETSVYYASSLNEARETQTRMEAETNAEWRVAARL